MPRKAQKQVIGAVTLYQRGNRWHASYTSPQEGRNRISLKVSNLKVAQQKAREIDELIQKGEYVTLDEQQKNQQTSCASFIDEFRAKHKGWSDSTWKGNSGMLDRLKLEWGDRFFASIGVRDIEALIAKRLDHDGVTQATANRNLACVKTLFKVAVRWGIVQHNPAERVKMLKEDPIIPQALTDRQLEAVLERLPAYAKVIVTVAVDTGMRSGELQQLEWSDVDFDRRQIRVSQSKNNEFRVIPMTRRVFDVLQEQLPKK